MARVYNFSAGPSMLPESVLKKAAAEMLDYEGSGQSVMEMSHRSKIYGTIIEGAEALLREVMNIPDNYKVLFLQGGASTQFAAIPMNLMTKSGKADYVITGQWAKKAHAEAARYGQANVVASSADKTFTYIPKLDPSTFTKDADYFYICMNNTIYGTVYHELPDTGDVPLVADISSCILSRPIDVSKFGVLYAGAQKNMAPAGLTVVIVREDLIGHAMDITPTMLNWKLTLTTVQCSTHRLATQSTLQSLFLSGLRTRLAVLIRCMKSTRRRLTFSTVSSILQSFSRVLLFPRIVRL